MTFTFKLSRRVARLRPILWLAAVLLPISCAPDDRPGTSSDPTSPSSTVSPEPSPRVQLRTGADEIMLSAAKGGNGKGRGRPQTGTPSISVSPTSVTLPVKGVQAFTATETLADGSTTQPSVRWIATGGTVDSSGKYTAGSTPGQYLVVATSSTGLADTATATVDANWSVVNQVVLSPATASVITGGTQQFTAVGKASDGSNVAISPIYKATGGTITAAGLYTAGQTAGTYRVIATDTASGKADTSAVTLTSPSPTLQAVVLTPASVSLAPGATQQFTASGKMSDGSTAPVTVSFIATGGTISSSGFYTAGSTTGTFRVIATQTGGTLADTAAVSITAPASSPTSGTTYFLATAETAGSISPWSYAIQGGSNSVPSSSADRAHDGGRSWKFERTDQLNNGYTQFLGGAPTTPIPGCQSTGRFCGDLHYSWWTYIDDGYTGSNWNMLLGWMTSAASGGSTVAPISHIGLEVQNGTLQVIYGLRNCFTGTLYTCPAIAGYQQYGGGGAFYRMTANSPAGIKAFPRGQWVHLDVRYKMAETNGQVTIWQDGVKIMDLTAPTMNTATGDPSSPGGGIDQGGMILQFGIYGGAPTDGTQRIYVDNFRVTDFLVVP